MAERYGKTNAQICLRYVIQKGIAALPKSTHAERIRQNADVSGTMFVDLGKLRSFKGSQKYAIPDGVDLKAYPSVVIWCAQFGVLISPADLAFER